MVTTTDLLQKARQFFDLVPPFSLTQLKEAFRGAAKKLHPDLTKRDTGLLFDEMRRCYDSLTDLAEIDPRMFSGEGTAAALRTTDGTPLYELGLGLGPTRNGRDCKECEHRGYTEEFGIDWVSCETCFGSGEVPRIMPCRYCENGKFKQQRSGHTVDCRVCKGTGKFKHPRHKEVCLDCLGVGRKYGKGKQVRYCKCFDCKGMGEIELFNPLLPKGRLV